jgi:hypothetical protein
MSHRDKSEQRYHGGVSTPAGARGALNREVSEGMNDKPDREPVFPIPERAGQGTMVVIAWSTEATARHRSVSWYSSPDGANSRSSMQIVAGRTSPSRRLIDERWLLARVAFWLVVFGVWGALHIPWLFRRLRARYS